MIRLIVSISPLKYDKLSGTYIDGVKLGRNKGPVLLKHGQVISFMRHDNDDAPPPRPMNLLRDQTANIQEVRRAAGLDGPIGGALNGPRATRGPEAEHIGLAAANEAAEADEEMDLDKPAPKFPGDYVIYYQRGHRPLGDETIYVELPVFTDQTFSQWLIDREHIELINMQKRVLRHANMVGFIY